MATNFCRSFPSTLPSSVVFILRWYILLSVFARLPPMNEAWWSWRLRTQEVLLSAPLSPFSSGRSFFSSSSSFLIIPCKCYQISNVNYMPCLNHQLFPPLWTCHYKLRWQMIVQEMRVKEILIESVCRWWWHNCHFLRCDTTCYSQWIMNNSSILFHSMSEYREEGSLTDKSDWSVCSGSSSCDSFILLQIVDYGSEVVRTRYCPLIGLLYLFLFWGNY